MKCARLCRAKTFRHPIIPVIWPPTTAVYKGGRVSRGPVNHRLLYLGHSKSLCVMQCYLSSRVIAAPPPTPPPSPNRTTRTHTNCSVSLHLLPFCRHSPPLNVSSAPFLCNHTHTRACTLTHTPTDTTLPSMRLCMIGYSHSAFMSHAAPKM